LADDRQSVGSQGSQLERSAHRLRPSYRLRETKEQRTERQAADTTWHQQARREETPEQTQARREQDLQRWCLNDAARRERLLSLDEQAAKQLQTQAKRARKQRKEHVGSSNRDLVFS